MNLPLVSIIDTTIIIVLLHVLYLYCIWLLDLFHLEKNFFFVSYK